MIEQLPEADQERVAEHMREYLADLEDDQKWNQAAREARKQIAEAKTKKKK